MIDRLLPRPYSRRVESLLMYSGSRKTPARFFLRAMVIGLGAGALAAAVFPGSILLAFAGGFGAMFALLHGFLILAVEKRSKFVENILPDALQLMAANIKSGFIPSRAMILSARKEFGPLSDSIKRAGKEMMTGRSLQESLTEVPKTIKSDTLDRTISLVIKGIKSGGQLVALFEETALDIRRRQAIKKEVKANILMYGIFIGFAGCAGAPVLYALSSYLVTTIGELGMVAEVPSEFQSRIPMMRFGEISVDPGFLFMFSLAAIIITTVFGGMIIGIIDSGKEKAGIKYIPIMMGAALAAFFLSGLLIQIMFGSLIPS